MPRLTHPVYRKYSEHDADLRSCTRIKELETGNRMDPWQAILSTTSAKPSNR
jgi:hypothetical protein